MPLNKHVKGCVLTFVLARGILCSAQDDRIRAPYAAPESLATEMLLYLHRGVMTNQNEAFSNFILHDKTLPSLYSTLGEGFL